MRVGSCAEGDTIGGSHIHSANCQQIGGGIVTRRQLKVLSIRRTQSIIRLIMSEKGEVKSWIVMGIAVEIGGRR